MKPAPFTYHRAATTAEAVDMLDAAGDDASVLAGGQSLIPLMNFRVAQPAHLVDVTFVDELAYIRTDDGAVAVGAATRQSALERAPDVARGAPLVAEAIRWVAHPPVRHLGTVVGSIAHADPAAELPAVLLALDGEVVLRGPGGERRVAAADFFTGPLMTAIEPGELVTEVRFPVAAAPGGVALVEYARRRLDFAVAGAAVAPTADGGTAIALFGVTETPLRATEAERLLAGGNGNGSGPAEAAEAATAGLSPKADVHGGPEYRRRVARACVERALRRARGGGA